MPESQTGEHTAGPSSPANAFGAALGFRTLTVEDGSASVALEIEASHLNDVGIVHGGAIFALADQAIAVAASSRGRLGVVSTVTIHFLSAARLGDELVATARPIRSGRLVSTFSIEVHRQQALIATATGQVIDLGERGTGEPPAR